MRAFNFAVALFALSSSSFAATQARDINTEYGFSLLFPTDVVTCVGKSGNHPHGFFGYLGPSNCRSRPSLTARAISWWADYNSAFAANARVYAESCVPPRGKNAEFSISNLRSFVCEERRGQAITLTVHAERGLWGKEWGNEESKTPFLFYDVSLSTDVAHRTADERTFKQFLRDARVLPLGNDR